MVFFYQSVGKVMEVLLSNRWLWKVLLIPVCAVLALGILGAGYPDA
jgi:hypothetical protein